MSSAIAAMVSARRDNGRRAVGFDDRAVGFEDRAVGFEDIWSLQLATSGWTRRRGEGPSGRLA
ncbi:hypothetical protein WEI85_47470 [Actinomycetes bacterium KLBMP 9797]